MTWWQFPYEQTRMNTNKVSALLHQALDELGNDQVVTQHQPNWSEGGTPIPRTVIWITPQGDEQMEHFKLLVERIQKNEGFKIGFTGMDRDTLIIAIPDKTQ